MSQELPWSLAELVRTQLDDLTAEQRRVLETAAVLGVTRVDFDLLSAVSGNTDEELIPILRHLVERGLLVEGEADVFSFRHALAREAIEADLLGRERRRLHHAALDALRRGRQRRLRSHRAPRIRRRAVRRHGRGRARRRAAITAFGIDATRRSQLAELGLSEVVDDPELLDIASRAAWLCGLLPDARSLAGRRIVEARRAGDLEAESAALRLICRLDHDVSDSAATAASTAELATLVERLDEGVEQGTAFAVLAEMHMLADDPDGANAWADRAGRARRRVSICPRCASAPEIERASALMNQRASWPRRPRQCSAGWSTRPRSWVSGCSSRAG